ncbi:MAG: hypothetical protein DM484_09855 [Candidatus Methylumidiphilus alinenensis]|uniref:Uncharacterized protein n=1 Tax=Candidatus Methylumidiphilus alinenensis TaxID=2202197 RepID=A0A2W4SZB9_9GAMM|nr:MAG: hypothetical protein DM484_09855 [Candidatus Methylumidiphilus alinenensis]
MSQPNFISKSFASELNLSPEFNFEHKRSSFNGNQPLPLTGLHASWPDGRQMDGGLGIGQPEVGLEGILKVLNGTIQTKQAMPQGNRHTRRSLRARMKGQKRAGQHRRIKAGKGHQTASAEVMRSHAAQTAIQRYGNAPSLIEGIKPTFTPIASTLPNGNTPTDISMGWDGSLWAIDPQGSPHSYDPINNIWDAHGEGIDAAATIDKTLYLFRGSEYVTVNLSNNKTSAPIAIAETWPNLPRSFQQGVTGAVNIFGSLCLFKEGWYLSVDGKISRRKLTDSDPWPVNSPGWENGLIDAVYGYESAPFTSDSFCYFNLIRGSEYITIVAENFPDSGLYVLSGPQPIADLLPPGLSTIDAAACVDTASPPTLAIFSGVDMTFAKASSTTVAMAKPNDRESMGMTKPVEISYSATQKAQYIPSAFQGWPVQWNPVLQHAPSGRTGNLWVATAGGEIVRHDGDSWNLAPGGSKGSSVSVGIDNSVWAARLAFTPIYSPGASESGISGEKLTSTTVQSFPFDFEGTGRQNYLFFYDPAENSVEIIKNDNGNFSSVYSSSTGIGDYVLTSADLALAFDYQGTGNPDHLLFYRPGQQTATVIANDKGSFSIVKSFTSGIGEFDLKGTQDRCFAYDYKSSGKLDHLVFYRPGQGAIFILENNGGDFRHVYSMGQGGSGIGGYNLASEADRGFAFDGKGVGRLDHLVFYRPGSGAIFILEKKDDGSFNPIYRQGDPGVGIGTYPINSTSDRCMAFDYAGNGRQDHLLFYCPGSGKSTIIQNKQGAYSILYQSAAGIGGYDLLSTADLGFAFDYDGFGRLDHLVFYRPGEGAIFILRNNGSPLASWDGESWTQHPQPPEELSQVSAGDSSRVWLRDSNGNVLRYADQQYTPNSQTTKAAHISANNDGTVWHCDHSPNAFCLVSESMIDPSQHVINPSVSSVLKVASTSYGASHCLTTHSDGSTVVYRYDSPYLFKTSKAYDGNGGLTVGLGKLYLTLGSGNDSTNWDGRLVCLDQHTGEELASYSFATSNFPSPPVVDSARQLIYVTTYGWETSPGGCLLVFDSASLQLLCAYSTNTNFTAPPTLQGSSLFCVDNSGVLYKFDTSTFAAGASIQPVWSLLPPNPNGGGTCKGVTLAPLVLGDRVYVALLYDDKNFFLNHCKNADSSDQQLLPLTGAQSAVPGFSGSRIVTNSKTPDAKLELYIPIQGGVYIVRPFAPNQADQVKAFLLPNQTNITDITYDDGQRPGQTNPQLWFGDNFGNLWSIDPTTAMKTGNAPYRARTATCKIESQPRLYQDPQGHLSVIFGLTGDITNESSDEFRSLYILDADSGTSGEIPTGVTTIAEISPLDGSHNGVLYVSGYNTGDSSGFLPQVMGIRVDALVQTQRNFIIESQLMQDFDQDKATANNTKGLTARYQTHLTVVDDYKAPRPNEPVKIWAEKPDTAITVDGVSYTIGPDEDQFANIHTGVDGTLTLFSEAVVDNPNPKNSKKVGNMFATSLRVWATFMNPYERIVVNPDHEFHKRVTTAYSDPLETDPDPDKINMNKVSNYQGNPLFSDSDQNAGQPKSAADAIGQMRQGVGFGGDSTSTRLSYSHLTQGRRLAHHSAEALKLAAAPQAYIAYPDLTGMGYFATNIPNRRSAVPATTVGFRLTILDPNNPSGNQPIFNPLTHAEALLAIDKLPDKPWEPSLESGLTGPRLLGNWWTDFWNWLLGALETVIHEIIVVVGEVVSVGIRLFVQGVEQVFHCQIKFLDDIASAVGSFFDMLEKGLDDLIEALSVLFNFDEILKTHRLIESYLKSLLQQAGPLITNTILPAVDGFLDTAEDEVKAWFDTLKADLGTDYQMSDLPSSQSTAHAAMSAGKNGKNPQSHAVQGSWGIQKMKTNMPGAKTPSSGLSVGAASADDPLTDIFSAFLTSIENNQDLKQVLNQLGTDFNGLFQQHSVGDFFKTLIKVMLDAIESLIIGGIALTKAAADGLLTAFDKIIDALFNPDTGLLTATIEIPFLSWFYEVLTRDKLSILSLLTLVVAIPVTVLCRVITGYYPSAGSAGLASTPLFGLVARQDVSVQITPAIQKWIISITLSAIIGISRMVQGLMRSLILFWTSFSKFSAGNVMEAYPKLFPAFITSNFLIAAFSFPLATSDISKVSTYTWAFWGITAVLAILSIQPTLKLDLVKADSEALKVIMAVWTCALSITHLAVAVVGYMKSPTTPGSAIGKDLGFSSKVLGDIPGILQPLALVGGDVGLALSAFSVVDGCAICALVIASAVETPPSLEQQDFLALTSQS